jgi:hypothetical protein
MQKKNCITCHKNKQLSLFEYKTRGLQQHEISFDHPHQLHWLVDELNLISEKTSEWLKDEKDRLRKEWMIDDIEMSGNILDAIEKSSGTTISLKDYQLSWLQYILSVNRDMMQSDLRLIAEEEEEEMEGAKRTLRLIDDILKILSKLAMDCRRDQCEGCYISEKKQWLLLKLRMCNKHKDDRTCAKQWLAGKSK